MIKATFTFEEDKLGMVNVTIEAPKADETETRGEAVMLITFMALNNLLADSTKHKALAAILGEEIRHVVDQEMQFGHKN